MASAERLVDGYYTFRDTRLRVEQKRYPELAETGQHPEIVIIGCCDSRVSPELIFGVRPGEPFVVRNVANFVPPYSPTCSSFRFAGLLDAPRTRPSPKQ